MPVIDLKLTLLIPYYSPTRPIHLLSGFDGSLYPDGLEKVPRRAAIPRSNQYAIRHSDYLIAYNRDHVGNTREMLRYAKRRESLGLIHIENLWDLM